MAALTLAAKKINLADGTQPNGMFGFDGTNYYPALVLLNEQGQIVTDSTGLPVAPAPSENHLGEIGGNSTVVVTSFTRPANTTAYATGQLIANSTTAGSVVPMTFPIARKVAGTGRITRARLSSTNAAATGAAFTLYLFKMLPTTTVGDGAAISGAVNGVTSVLIGQFAITMASLAWSDGAKGISTPSVGSYITFDAVAGSQNIYGLLASAGAYTPTSGETLTVALEADRD